MNVNELCPFCCRDPSNLLADGAAAHLAHVVDMGHPHATMAVGSCHHRTPKTANDKIEKCQNCSSEAYYVFMCSWKIFLALLVFVCCCWPREGASVHSTVSAISCDTAALG